MKAWLTSRLPSSTTLKKLATSPLTELQKLDSSQHRKLLLITIAFGAFNLAYSLFSLYTLLSFGLVALGIFVYLKISLQDIRRKGLIAYLPARYQKILLNRSLFDVLCDMWFIPKVSIYVKTLVSPFFLKIEPAEAIHQLKELPMGARKVFLTKGVVNVMPNLLKTAILPQNEEDIEESSDTSSVTGQEIVPSLKALELKDDLKSEERSELDIMMNESTRRGSEITLLDSLRIGKIGQISLHNRVTQTSTDDDGLVNHNFSMSKQMEVKKTLPLFADINPIKTHLDYKDGPKNPKGHTHSYWERSLKNRTTPKVRKTFLHDVDSDLRAEVLSSNKTVKSNTVELSEKWDKLELFTRKRREKMLMKQRNGPNSTGRKFELKGPLQTLHNIATLLSKDALMNKLEDKNLIKIFMVSTMVLLLQFSVSKKTRLWCYNTFHILMYITGVALSTGSMGLLVMKLRNKYRLWKEEQQRERAAAAVEARDTE